MSTTAGINPRPARISSATPHQRHKPILTGCPANHLTVDAKSDIMRA